MLIALPMTGIFSALAFCWLRFSSCQVTIKLFCTLPATTGSQFMVTWQVSSPVKDFPEHLSLKVKPSAGGSASVTETILTEALPLVPKVKTFLASVPKTTCPSGTGFGVAVRGISPSTTSPNSRLSSNGPRSPILIASALSVKTGSSYSCSRLLLCISRKTPIKKMTKEVMPIVKITRLVFFT